ncbi:MAG: hypothetical protein IKO35_06980, partial [Elusimicrobiaceae bacterium]|nr:hypothetical protein [Elusimicrobiaceae bacterium]
TSMEDTLAVLIPRVEVQASVSSLANDKLEKELDLDTKRDTFKNIDHSNELTGLSLAEASRVLEPRIERAAPGIFNKQTKPLFAELLALYHRGGEDKMKEGVWEYALTFPIYNFNNNAQKNNAYFFLITLLYVFGLCNCAGVIFFGDDL